MEKINKNYKWILFVIMLVSSLWFVFQSTQKLLFHEDEVMTFCLANSTTDGVLSTEYFEKVNAGDIFSQAMTVHNGQGFNYGMVWVNQKLDVHPPLYYSIIHTISSLFPEQFNIWMGLGVNLFFMLMCILLMYQCAYEFQKDRTKALVITGFFAICPAVMEINMFLRMYMMLMCMCLLFLRWVLKNIYSEKIKPIQYLWLFLITVAGALTHYYFIVFVVLFSIEYGLIQLFRKYYKKAAIFSIVMVVAGVISDGLFPPMIFHIFTSYRGEEAFHNMVHVGGSPIYRAVAFFSMLDTKITSLMLIPIIIGVVIIMKRRRISWKNERYLVLIAPTFFYLLVVAKSAAYIEPRYISPVYPCVILIVLSVVMAAVKRGFPEQKQKRVIAIVVVFMVIGSNILGGWEYSFKNKGDIIKICDEYASNDCVFIFDDGMWQADRHYGQLPKYRSTTFVPAQALSHFKNTEVAQTDDSFVTYMAISDDTERMADRILEQCEGVDSYEKLYNWKFTDVYYFYKK